MYLVERIIGIVTYMLLMLLICYYISHNVSDIKKLKKVLFLYNIMLSVLAFYYVPSASADLFRHYQTLDIYSSLSFGEILNIMRDSTIPLTNLYFFIFAKIGIKGLLPAVTSFIFHFVIFHILCVSAEKYNYSMKTVSLSLLLFMELGKFLEVISGIKTLLAFSIICYCIFEELFNNKSFYKHIFLYAIACLVHSSAIALTIIRLVFLIFQKEKKIIYKIINVSLLLLISVYFATHSSIYLDAMFDKADHYLNFNVYSYVWEYIISWISVLFVVFSILLFRKTFNKNIEIKNVSNFILVLSIVLLLYNSEYSIFSRFQNVISILFLPVYSYILDYIENNKSKYYKSLYIFIVIIIYISIFMIVGTRGNLSGYKFFIR